MLLKNNMWFQAGYEMIFCATADQAQGIVAHFNSFSVEE